MSTNFSADDILSIAERIEKNGADFYRAAAGNTCDPDAKQVLLNLAGMEDDHLRTFADMRADLKQDEKRQTAFDPEGEEAAYLRTMADSNVFNPKVDPAERLTGEESMEDILKIAIGLEKDSIVFYQAMKKFFPESLGRDKIDAIIDEEYKHIVILNEELQGS